jgi:subtilase family serine protease
VFGLEELRNRAQHDAMHVHLRMTAAGLCLAAMSTFAADRPDWVARLPLRLRNQAVTAHPQGYTPAQIRHAYGLDQVPGRGQGQTIAIVDAFGSPTVQNDLNAFSFTFGMLSTQLEIVYPQGRPRRFSKGWALETSLDVQWAHAIAPEAKIMLVIARAPTLKDLVAAAGYAASNGATHISMSWGGYENPVQVAYDPAFRKEDVVFVAASGDSGSITMWPAASPDVIAVGGTTLTLDPDGNIVSETGWDGSGGGQSRLQARPSYQDGWNASSQRGIPDVSYNGDPRTGFPVYYSASGRPGWIVVGGTSAGAPQIAAILAVVNSSRATPLENVHEAIYEIAAANHALYFHDIIEGDNGKYLAVPGYDFVTGLGTPLCNLFVPALVAR